MIFDWIRDRRRADLARQPFPNEWISILQESIALYPILTEDEQSNLHGILRVLVEEKNWEGCGGQVITDEIKVCIAAQASFLLLNIEHDYYANVESVLVYPSAYIAKGRVVRPGGVVEEGPSARLGEAWEQGPVILSWQDVKSGGMNARDGRNVVLHEFAHKLDLSDGRVNGVPRLENDQQYERWAEVMSAEFKKLEEESDEGAATLLGSYAASNAGEFFAVSTEFFFEKPTQLRDVHPDLYEVLKAYYRQDTADRMDRHAAANRSETG